MKRIDYATIRRIADDLRDILGDDYDEQTYFDTLDGETDVADILANLVEAEQDDHAKVDAIKARMADLKARADRIASRADAHRNAQKLVMQAADMRKIELPCVTLSIRNGSVSVQITDESAVPTQLCQIKRIPDKKAIRAQIEAGEEVPGAALVHGEETLSVRVK